MESSRISNDSITASSSSSWFIGLSPVNGRLHYRGAYWQTGGWMPEAHDQNPWLQVDFGAETRIMGISTQGSYLNDFWVKSYSLQHSNNCSSFKQYQQNYRNKVNIKNWTGSLIIFFLFIVTSIEFSQEIIKVSTLIISWFSWRKISTSFKRFTWNLFGNWKLLVCLYIHTCYIEENCSTSSTCYKKTWETSLALSMQIALISLVKKSYFLKSF